MIHFQFKNVLRLWLCTLVTCSYAQLFDWVGGNFEHSPQELNQVLEPATKHWVDSLLAPLDTQRMADVHVHLLSLGHDQSGAWVDPELRDWTSPKKFAQFKTYLSAAGVKDTLFASEQSWERFNTLVQHHPKKGRFFLFAFAQHYNKQGQVDSSLTSFHIPNQLAWDRAQTNPRRYVPVISIHPYQPGALEELQYWGEKGVRYLKWLPNAMGIPPMDSSIIPFYQMMAHYNIALISHSGEEHAVEADEHQAYGNPVGFQLALDQGVQVILAHAATTGHHVDPSRPEQGKQPAYQLLAQMMDNPKYQDQLFLDLSAVSLYNHLGPQLDTLLQRTDWHHRMMDGSDYPLPAINFLIRTKTLVKKGYITAIERKRLNEVYKVNPLLFDLLVKRVLKHPKSKESFSIEAFHLPENLPYSSSLRD